MSEDRKKIFSKKGTGTVPKIKYGNNRINQYTLNQHNILPNNLSSDWLRQDFSGPGTNCSQNIHPFNSYMMESPLADDHNYSLPRQNSELHHLNMASNGPLLTPSISESESRRDSVGTIPKCQNVSKFPDKQKIEDKLNKIREYLRVTTSLMSTLKNSEDPQAAEREKEHFEKMVKDLKDSETKLLGLLKMYEATKEMQEKESEIVENGTDNYSEPSTSGYQSNISQRNEIEDKMEQSNRKIKLLQEQQNALISLQKKAENQLLDAKQTQEKLLKVQQKQKEENRQRNDKILQERRLVETQVASLNKAKTENNFDATIKELEDTLNGLKTYHNNADMDVLQERLENSNQLIHMLGTRDAQLNSEHLELQEKLNELQTKKQQIDQLASELQNLNEENDDEDIGQQVRKIVTMKQQLSKLKDMLEIVKNAELRLVDAQNENESDYESQENFNFVEKNDNLRQDVHCNQTNRAACDNTVRIDNNARANEQWPTEKESNKVSSNIRERERMLAELKAKKRELEEIIFKQKDRTLINNDICSESSINKSDTNGFEGMPSGYCMSASGNRQNQRASLYSSDECPEEDINEYSDIRGEPNFHHTQSRLSKHREDEIGLEVNSSVDYSTHYQTVPSRTSEGRSNAATSGAAPFNRQRERSTSVNEAQSKNQIQKQLEAIQGMCQSLIEQQHHSNQANLRSNHTPSPLYTEPRRYMSPYSRDTSVLNVVNPVTETTGFPSGFNAQCYGLNDFSNNQNILAANTLQLQAFLLNTLNQCCQMLWFQQREIASLRHSLTLMQERMMGGSSAEQNYRSMSDPPSAHLGLPPFFGTASSGFRSPSQSQTSNNQKTNQVAAACSMPNLNQGYVPTTSNEQPYENRNNVRCNLNTRLLEANFNNAMPVHNNHNTVSDQPLTNNTVLHNINPNVSQPLPSQIWNGQALNNQVAPGNRANNYWDNFRSYSRQNLLSTSKSNEGVQNTTTTSDRSNRSQQERSHPQCPGYALPKSNMAQNESVNLTVENVPRQHPSSKLSSNSVNSTPRKSSSTIPPDVLNVGHVQEEEAANCTCSSSSSNPNFSTSSSARKFNLHVQQEQSAVSNDDRKFNFSLSHEQNQLNGARKFHFRLLQGQDGVNCENRKYNLSGSQERRSSGLSNTSDDSTTPKELPSRARRNRNEWNDGEESSNNSPKSKLFEQLRDSVYKEVANLISANEMRPHFLIQLFRDLQLVNSDPLRHKTLHSIQTVITNPVVSSESSKAASCQTSANQAATSERNTQVRPEFFTMEAAAGWPQSPASSQTSSNMDIETTNDPDMNNVNNIIKIVIPFLKRHQDDVFQEELLEMLKDLLIKAMPFGEIFANTNIQEATFHKHFAAIITEALYKFQGKCVQEIRKELVRTITEVLLGEFSFIHLVQENIPENREPLTHNSLQLSTNNASLINADDNILMINIQPAHNGIADDGNTPQIENGDLAEADQSHIEVEEEGAVGGVIGLIGEAGNDEEIVTQDDSDTPKIEFAVSTEVEADLEEQGLDQVPTRLTTSCRSHSGTPSRGKKKRKR